LTNDSFSMLQSERVRPSSNVGRVPFLALNLGLDVADGIGRLDVQGDSFSGESLHEDLHSSTSTENQVERRFLLNVVVRVGTVRLEVQSGGRGRAEQ
jgi:hypothetical protein